MKSKKKTNFEISIGGKPYKKRKISSYTKKNKYFRTRRRRRTRNTLRSRSTMTGETSDHLRDGYIGIVWRKIIRPIWHKAYNIITSWPTLIIILFMFFFLIRKGRANKLERVSKELRDAAVSGSKLQLLSGKIYFSFRKTIKLVTSFFSKQFSVKAHKAEDFLKSMVTGGTLFSELGFYMNHNWTFML